MNFSVFYSLYGLKSKYNYPLCDSWYTVFRRNSRFIQDRKVAGNPKSSGLPREKARIKECEEYCMYYLSVRETAEKWGINVSLVRRYCQQGRIPGAVQKKDGWCIPEDAVHPTRTVFEHTEEPELPELAKKLQNQKKKRNFHGLYDFVVIDLTYSSSRMASCRLTRQQVETIFRK